MSSENKKRDPNLNLAESKIFADSKNNFDKDEKTMTYIFIGKTIPGKTIIINEILKSIPPEDIPRGMIFS